jgi:hypothetical protein
MPYPKFNNLDVIWDLPEDCEEWNHVETTLARLESHLVSLRFVDRFVLFITSQTEKLEIAIDTPVVVYHIKDKVHEVPSYVNDVFLVFKNYVPFYPPSDKVRSVPLGCNKHITSLDVQLIVDRNIDLFFMGSEDNREDFFTFVGKGSLSSTKAQNIVIERSVEIQYNVYAQSIAQSKIALCPAGISCDTFRIYEAMRAGCVVIVPRQVPAWFNHGWPLIELDDWCELKPIADSLLNNPKKLQEISDQTRAWWEEKCSEEAVARYMARELSLNLMKNNL